VKERSKRKRTMKMVTKLRSLGYQVEPLSVQLAERECCGQIFSPDAGTGSAADPGLPR